jgi:hypothetical protein
MYPRLKKLGSGLVTCIALIWFGNQALYGEGALRVFSILMLIALVATTALAILDRVRPRPKRRRARECDADS